MKREFLQELDLGEGAKLSKEAIDAIMAEYGKDKTAQEGTITTLRNQLSEANTKLEGYDPTWKEKADAAKKALEGKQFEFALEKAVSGAKPRNVKAVLALLDRDKLSFAGGEVIGLDKQLEGLKKGEDTAFLFQEQAARKTGMSHEGGGPVGGAEKNAEANAAIRAAFGRSE